MSFCTLPWGEFGCEDGAEGYVPLRQKAERVSPAVVLTEAGEILIRAQPQAEGCIVAIVLSRSAAQLTRPQQERLQRAWDIARTVCEGETEMIFLQPMPHHWRFARVDYLTWEEWVGRYPQDSGQAANLPDDKDARC